MTLNNVVKDISDALVQIDKNDPPFKAYHPGVGPYGEPQLVKRIEYYLNQLKHFDGRCKAKRNPDLLIEDYWAIEFKIARPYGDNGKEAENWTVNLLHPYPGNSSAIGDCLKLREWKGKERKAVLTISYEHSPAIISTEPLLKSFEAIAKSVVKIKLGNRIEQIRTGLKHPIHQQAKISAWEVI
ncbi:MAG TPA: hypothetical protein VEW28_08500 [Candidatus Kapabacteria bacterium]|nr:hypothetical protein [Candidatus Kapabacteria bacterium]